MGSCGATCGITRERARHQDAARALVAGLHPDGWSPDAMPPRGGPGSDGETLGRFIRAVTRSLPCQPVVVPGSAAEWVYLVATTGPRTWVATRESSAEAPDHGVESGIRVGFSHAGTYATLQEFSMAGVREPAGAWIEEIRQVGVADRRLQLFVKAAQGLLRRDRVVALDAVFLTEPMADAGGAGARRLGDTPLLWHGLFDHDPPGTVVGTFLPFNS